MLIPAVLVVRDLPEAVIDAAIQQADDET